MDLIGRKLGKYEITEFIGQGGMASVYKAFQPGVERDVAIKVLHPHLATSDDFVARFLREARSSGKLHHPHIMPVIDCDSEAGVHYLVLNYIGGGTLEELLKQEKSLPADQAVQVATQIGEALHYAHENEMIHRDIKPANIMFLADTKSSSATHALLADFGIARLKDEANNTALTAVGSLVGTPNYMSPEAAQGETSDERSDIYSLGVVLYEMVTGKTPYQADTLYSFLMKQANDPLPPPSELNPNVPPALEAVILKSLAKEPADRYESAPAFVAALRDAAANPGKAMPRAAASLGAGNPETKKHSLLPLLLAGLGVLAVAAGTTFFMLNMGTTSEIEPEPSTDLATPAEPPPTIQTEPTQASESITEQTAVETSESAEASATTETNQDNSDEAVGGAEAATAANNESTSESAGAVDDSPAVAEDNSADQELVAVIETSDEIERSIGQLQIQTGANGDTFDLQLAQVPLPQAESHYELWLGDTAGALINLGPLALVDNAVTYRAQIPADTLADYATVLISRELDTDDEPDILDSLIFSSTAPSQLLVASDLSAADAPAADTELSDTILSDTDLSDMDLSNIVAMESLLTSALEQSALAETHVGFLQDAVTAEDMDAARMHAEHVVNIMEGESGQFFGDLDKDGLPQNPGDGIGVFRYIDRLEAGVDESGDESGGDESVAAVADALLIVRENAEVVVEQALKIFAADTVDEMQPMVTRSSAHVADLKKSFDLDGDGAVLLAIGEMALSSTNGAIVDDASLQMARFDLFTRSTMLTSAELPRPRLADDAVAGRFRISLVELAVENDAASDGDGGGYDYGGASAAGDDISYTSHYTIEIDMAVALDDDELYEVWAVDALDNLALLGVSEDEGLIHGQTDAMLLMEVEQILVTHRSADAESPSSIDDLMDAIRYHGRYDAAIQNALRDIYYAGDLSESGLLWAATEQLALASAHTGFSQTGINDADLAEARRHSEHVINILIGEEGEFYGDIDGDGLPQNPGDGVGTQVYIQELTAALESAMEADALTPEQLFAADRATASLQNASERIDVALKKAIQVFAADTDAEADPIVRELVNLLFQARDGLDFDGNGVVDPVEAEGGLAALQGYAELLSVMPLYLVE